MNVKREKLDRCALIDCFGSNDDELEVERLTEFSDASSARPAQRVSLTKSCVKSKGLRDGQKTVAK